MVRLILDPSSMDLVNVRIGFNRCWLLTELAIAHGEERVSAAILQALRGHPSRALREYAR